MSFTPDWEQIEAEAADLLARYLRLDTTNPPGNEIEAARFLAAALTEDGLSVQVAEPAPGRANLLAVVPATQRAEPPLVLTHHMDVVTASGDTWSLDPFGGAERDGYLYGRGALDTKGLGILHLMGLRLLLRSGLPRRRDVMFLALADEEVNSLYGARWVLENWSARLTGATVWGEGGFGVRGLFGLPALFAVATDEKVSLTLKLVAQGRPGHGSTPHADNANEILVRALGRVLAWRRPRELTEQNLLTLRLAGLLRNQLGVWLARRLPWVSNRVLGSRRLAGQPLLQAMVQDTLSVTILRGGDKDNVIPGQAAAVLDVRLLPHHDFRRFCRSLQSVLDDERIRIEILDEPAPAPASPMSNPLYATLDRIVRRHVPGAVVVPLQSTGVTDARWFRRAGLETYGLAPILLDEAELAGIHGTDERIARSNLRLGSQVVFETLLALCAMSVN